MPEGFYEYKIAQISDLHNKNFHGRLTEKVKEAEPDIIVITGDLIDSRNTKIDTAVNFVRQAVKIAPTYFVSGNHEQSSEEYDLLKLVFCGHAHGGQIRIPFNGGIFAPGQDLFPKYTDGIHSDGETSMVVSRGLGNSIFPFRIFKMNWSGLIESP